MSAHNSGGLPELLAVQCEADFELRLRYNDGTEGIVDLSSEVHKGGVFEALKDPAVFALARIGEFGQIEWPSGIDMCPNALYLRLTKKTPRELFPDLTQQPAALPRLLRRKAGAVRHQGPFCIRWRAPATSARIGR